jgi:type IV pilus assembly protein PilC
MPVFGYTVKTEDGRVMQASMEASSRQEALSLIRSQTAGVVVALAETAGPRALSGRDTPAPSRVRARPRLRSGGIRPRDLAVFFRQLAISVNAGVSLRDSIESITADLEHAAFRLVLLRVGDRLHDGRSFSQSLAAEGRVFPPICVALIRTAEEAGSMGQTLDQLAASIEKNVALTRKIRSITAYPLFVAFFFAIVMVIMTFFILPQFQSVFGGWGAELPLLTRVVFRANKIVVGNAVPIFVILAAGVGGLVVWSRTAIGALWIDRFLLRLPLLGLSLKKLAIARFCKNLAIMIRGGVPIATAIEITAAVSGNKAVENALLGARDRILRGSDITTGLADEGLFPRLLIRMVGVGESSGRLPEVLDRVAASYEDDVEGSVMTVTALFEPIIIVVFGAIVLTFVMAIYLPVFTVASHMR